MRKSVLTALFLTFGMAGVGGFAGAQTGGELKIPNSKVTYQIVNASSVYLAVDKGEDYVEFYCNAGDPLFFLSTRTSILTQADYDAEKTPVLTYKVDNQEAKTAKTTPVAEGFDEEDPTHLNMLAVQEGFDKTMLDTFRVATLVFPTKGFAEAWKAVNNCK